MGRLVRKATQDFEPRGSSNRIFAMPQRRRGGPFDHHLNHPVRILVEFESSYIRVINFGVCEALNSHKLVSIALRPTPLSLHNYRLRARSFVSPSKLNKKSKNNEGGVKEGGVTEGGVKRRRGKRRRGKGGRGKQEGGVDKAE